MTAPKDMTDAEMREALARDLDDAEFRAWVEANERLTEAEVNGLANERQGSGQHED